MNMSRTRGAWSSNIAVMAMIISLLMFLVYAIYLIVVLLNQEPLPSLFTGASRLLAMLLPAMLALLFFGNFRPRPKPEKTTGLMSVDMYVDLSCIGEEGLISQIYNTKWFHLLHWLSSLRIKSMYTCTHPHLEGKGLINRIYSTEWFHWMHWLSSLRIKSIYTCARH